MVYADVVGEELRPALHVPPFILPPAPPAPAPFILPPVPPAPVPFILPPAPFVVPPAPLPICKDVRGGDLDVTQAKNLLRRNRLSTKGNKRELCDRLVGANLARRHAASPRRRPVRRAAVVAPAPVLRRCSNGRKVGNELSVDEARDMLRRAGLPTVGNKGDLCTRLRNNGLCL